MGLRSACLMAIALTAAACSLLVGGDSPDCERDAVFAGGNRSCGIVGDDGALDCWGQGAGISSTARHRVDSARPTFVRNGIETLSVGFDRSCAIDGAARLLCWGQNLKGQTGVGDALAQVAAPSLVALDGVSSVSAGFERTCAIAAGDVYCWGEASFGALGRPSGLDVFAPPDIPLELPKSAEIAVGQDSACAIAQTNGTVRCWGSNSSFQLGVPMIAESDVPVEVGQASLGGTGAPWEETGDRPVAIAVSNHACVATEAGLVYCWGNNDSGQLSLPLSSGRLAAPRQVVFDDAPEAVIVDVAVGLAHSCARSDAGELFCWGDNRVGQLGLPVTSAPPRPFEPIPTRARSDVASVATGERHTCITTRSGQTECWGSDSVGQLAQADSVLSRSPVKTQAIAAASRLAAGAANTCGIDGESQLWCWGSNEKGQLGDDGLAPRSSPAQIGLSGPISDVSVGDGSICAVTDSEVRCWGDNRFGQLGVGDVDPRIQPTPVVDLVSPTDVELGSTHGCAIVEAGAVACWGRNSEGQLGIDSAPSAVFERPVVLDAAFFAGPVVELALGRLHTCARTDSGAYCWGSNGHFQIGNGGTTNELVPVAVDADGATITRIAAGDLHTCATDTTGALYCWGNNDSGQAGGDGRSRPEVVSGIDEVSDVALSRSATCALSAGRVFCFGSSAHGELGNGSDAPSPIPVPVELPATAIDIEAGAHHVCARLEDERVFCWGSDADGKLGLGRALVFREPAAVDCP